MSKDLEEALMEVFELGAAFGFALHGTHSDISQSEIRARARNKFETMKEEMNGT